MASPNSTVLVRSAPWYQALKPHCTSLGRHSFTSTGSLRTTLRSAIRRPEPTAVLRFSHRDNDGTEFADEFIRRFIAAEYVSGMACSVSILQMLRRKESRNYLRELCVTPRLQNVDAPKTRIFEVFPAARCEVQKCDLFVLAARAVSKTSENDVSHLFVMTLTVG